MNQNKIVLVHSKEQLLDWTINIGLSFVQSETFQVKSIHIFLNKINNRKVTCVGRQTVPSAIRVFSLGVCSMCLLWVLCTAHCRFLPYRPNHRESCCSYVMDRTASHFLAIGTLFRSLETSGSFQWTRKPSC